MNTALSMGSVIETWLGAAKTYEPCSSCGEWKVLIWLQMCGRCSIEHKRRTAEAAAIWKAEYEAIQARKKGEAHAPGL